MQTAGTPHVSDPATMPVTSELESLMVTFAGQPDTSTGPVRLLTSTVA